MAASDDAIGARIAPPASAVVLSVRLLPATAIRGHRESNADERQGCRFGDWFANDVDRVAIAGRVGCAAGTERTEAVVKTGLEIDIEGRHSPSVDDCQQVAGSQ